MKKTVVAIGEILWDVFPSFKKAGGSSTNVALHLHKQGINSKLISAVGQDEHGAALLNFLEKHQFPTTLVQIHETLPTSTVSVLLDDRQQATYQINQPVAWDEIALTPSALSAVSEADAFVYCSLTCRNVESKDTILTLLTKAKLKIFDINLRAPFYNMDTLTMLLLAADILKINDDELAILKHELHLIDTTEEQLLKQLAHRFNIQIICLTLGGKGAQVLYKDQLLVHKGYAVDVVDTVGAGDAFLATFVSSYLNGFPIATVLDRACKVGAFVAGKEGANPDYGPEIFEQ